MAEDEKAPQWEVISQVEEYSQNDAGAFTPGVRVTYRTAAGVIGSVFVPATDYNAATVRRMIADKAKVASDIGQLRG